MTHDDARELLGKLARGIAHGGSFTLYAEGFTWSVDQAVKVMPEADAKLVLNVAAAEFDYMAKTEAADDLWCRHEIEKNYCPHGCGEV